MKSKNILLMVVSCVLVATIAIGGTVAYLQDDDSDVNVMTVGNVTIEQIEQQLDENGNLVPFVQAKELYPGTGVSKIVTVKNTGASDAYFRTLIAFEDVPGSETFGVDFPINEAYRWSWGAPEATIVVNGVTYQVYEAVYNQALKAGETSPASLTKVEFAKTCTNEDMEKLGGTYDILVASQAVQTASFANAQSALDEAFGDITATNHPWVDGVVMPSLVTSADELQAALDSATGDAIITFADDIIGNVVATQKEGVNITIDGNGYEYTGTIEIYGQARFKGTETLTIQNVNFVADETMDFISCNTTESAKRYAHNVTIQNCSFTGNNAEVVGARFRQCYNITMKDCTADGMYGIIWATGGNGYVFDNVVAADCRNGISVGTSTPVTIKNCDLNVGEYGVRADNAVAMTLENNKISAKQPVIVRKLTTAGLVLNLSGNTLNATGTDNYQVILTKDADDAAYVAPSVDYTLNGANGVVIFK